MISHSKEVVEMLFTLFRVTSAALLIWIVIEITILVGKLMETKEEEGS